MRKKLLPLLLTVVGIVVLGLGIASGTVLKPDTVVTLTTPKLDESRYVTLTPEVLGLVSPNVTIEATDAQGGEVAMVVGRQADVVGWIGNETSYAVTGAQDWSTISVDKVEPENQEPSDEASSDKEDTKTDEESEPEGPAVVESDMWTDVITGEGSAQLKLSNLEAGRAVLVTATGADATTAPTIALTWERDVATPLLFPGIALGVLLIGVGVFLLKRTPKSATKTPKKGGKWTDVKAKEGTSPQDSSQASPFASVISGTESPSPFPQTMQARNQEPPAPHTAHEAPSMAQETERPVAEASTASFAPITDVPIGRTGRTDQRYAAQQPSLASPESDYANATQPLPADSLPSVAGDAPRNVEQLDLSAVENLNTAELQQLGLTRRQLRQMQDAQGIQHPATPQPHRSATSMPFGHTQPEPTPVQEPAPEPYSKTSASNWRAAWGVRSAHAEQESAHRHPGQYNQAGPVESGFGEQYSAPEPVRAPQPEPVQRDVRQPAAWWDDPAHQPAQRSAQPEQHADQPSQRNNAAQSAPATRRALHSQYRADAERNAAGNDSLGSRSAQSRDVRGDNS
ncbi:hypothetical protein [Timonella sp. A28]|uniref:hypothetical protein n=1 Tax=Timonella sp. A28 TaxID=3442640 RepID=UPI003EBFF0F6